MAAKWQILTSRAEHVVPRIVSERAHAEEPAAASIRAGAGGGDPAVFRTFVEFVEASQPRGLGTSIEMLKNICHDDQLARDLIDQAVRNPIGTNQHVPVPVNNVNGLARPKGNSRDRALRQLRDHRPDLHARVIAKKLSPMRR